MAYHVLNIMTVDWQYRPSYCYYNSKEGAVLSPRVFILAV